MTDTTESTAAPTDGTTAAPAAPEPNTAEGNPGGTPGTATPVLGGEPAAEAPAAPADGADTGATPTGAPEAYTFNLPDGVELDPAFLETVTPLYRDLGLTQEQAQKLVDYEVAQMKAGEEARVSAFTQLTQSWLDAAKADKEIGGEAFQQSVAHAQLAVQKFGTSGLNELLRSYGIGNHPEIIRTFARIGAKLREDQPTAPLTPVQKELDTLALMYPNNVPKS